MDRRDNSDLKRFVERIEHLAGEKAAIAADIRTVYAEAKDAGLDVRAMRAIISRRAKDADKLREHEAKIAEYLLALGSLASLPLGQAAIERAATLPNISWREPAA